MNKKRPTFYILDDQGNPIPEPDLRRWEEPVGDGTWGARPGGIPAGKLSSAFD